MPDTDYYKAQIEERTRVMEIVRKQIGFATISDETPSNMTVGWFRDLYERIQKEVCGPCH